MASLSNSTDGRNAKKRAYALVAEDSRAEDHAAFSKVRKIEELQQLPRSGKSGSHLYCMPR